jgi:hypothetical protein
MAASMTRCGPLAPLCAATSTFGGGMADVAGDLVLAALGRSFLAAADQVSTLALAALGATTSIDLSAQWFRSNVAVIAAVALPVVVGLFVIQVIGSVLRREPGGLGRAVVGVGKALLGSVLALAVTQLALTGVDGICEFIAASAGTTVGTAAGKFLNVAALTATSSAPVLQMLLGLAVIVGCLLLWGVMLFRKAALILVAVFAPIAFAGAVWDQTRVWTRRWLEVVAALVFCKVVIVVVFVVGASAFTGVSPDPNGAAAGAGGGSEGSGTAGLSDLLVGLLLLSIAVFAPWLTWRFVHWSGMEAAGVMHSAVAANPVTSGARNVGAQSRRMAQQVVTSMVLGGAGAAAGGAKAAAGAGARGGGGSPPLRPPVAPAGPGGGGWP